MPSRAPQGPDSDPTAVDSRPHHVSLSDEMPTSLEAPGAKRPAPSGERSISEPSRGDVSESHSALRREGASIDPMTSIHTLRDTMEAQDAKRTRAFVLLGAVVCVVVSIPVPFLGGDALAKLVFNGAMVVTAAALLWFHFQLRDPKAYSMGRVLAVGHIAIVGAFTGIYFFGVFSPGPVIVPFGLYFFGLAGSFRGTLTTYLLCAGLYVALAVPVGLGLVPDRGLIQAPNLSHVEAIIVIVTVEVIYAATFLIARISRHATESALAEHDRAVRAIAGRDALLHEARMDLEGVLRARGLGRFTNERVGNYRVGEILGRGGMGEVYEARHIDSEETVALKLLHPHVLDDADAVRRFLRECELTGKLQVPNVVRVLETSEQGAPIPFIAMERLHGRDLADRLRDVDRMSMRDVLRIIREVGRGLDAARNEGIIHRDIKPRNLFLTDAPGTPPSEVGGVWKILDFGVSKLSGDATITQQNVVGTPSYMAPEQATGGEVNHRTDLYALGVIAYRALTGRPAFGADSAPAILYQVVHEMPPRPSEIQTRLEADVDLVLGIALAKDPWDRFDSAAELADALEKAAKGRLPEALRERATQVMAKHPWS